MTEAGISSYWLQMKFTSIKENVDIQGKMKLADEEI